MPKAKVLIVEDEEIVAFDIESTLKDLDYHVLKVVSSGEDAIATAGDTHPDLVLMDIRLRGQMDGIEAAKEIRENFRIPVVYLTAYADLSTLERAKITEPFGYLLKPFEDKEVQTTIEIALVRHQAEERMRQALEKEKELSELKSRFIAIASHEFRTPLATINSSTDLLERYCRENMDAKKSKHFQQIKNSIALMIQLLDDVLLIGKADAGKLEFQPTSLDLVDFCHNLVEELQVNAGNNYTIAFSTYEEKLTACMDENLLRTILSNLLSNAIKYSPDGGTVAFDLTCQDEISTFRIQDWGVGIPVEDQKHLFTPFHRATNVRAIKGTGLGLSIVKKCVDLHHGEIFVNSAVGSGTTFTVTLPIIGDW